MVVAIITLVAAIVLVATLEAVRALARWADKPYTDPPRKQRYR